MQNVQNAAEIKQRVINLVKLYRRKAGWESQTAKDAKADLESWNQMSYDMMVEEGFTGGGLYGEGPHTEGWIKNLMVNEQLLGHFYAEVAGEDANKEILDELLPDIYDMTIFTEEEESFLKSHFKEMVNYIIVTPNDECLKLVNRYDSRDAYVIPNEVLELIGSRTNIAKGSKILYPYTGFGQFTNLYNDCKFYCDVMNTWMQVSAYANNADVEYADVEIFKGKGSYDAVVSYLVGLSDKGEDIFYLCKAYESLKPGGKFILICPSRLLVEGPNPVLRRRLVEDRAIKEIIQLPQVMSNNASHDTYCLLIAEKGRMEGDVIFVDARIANNDLDTKHYMLSFDNDKFNAIIQNDGIDPNTGLRKVIQVSSTELLPEILIPQVYVIERPSEAEHPVPLSSLCSMESTRVGDLQFNLPEDTPWIHISDLTPLYTGDMDISGIRKADCPNNPPFVEGSNKDYGFDENGKFDDSIWAQIGKPKGHRVLDYRNCTYVDGNSDAVLYERSVESGVQVAVVRATGKPYAVSSGILVFRPKDSFSANSLAALLRLPIVYRQLLAYQEYGLDNYLDDILVPTDKRIIGDELLRMKKEKSVTNELGDKVQAMKTEYINEVRMRKHDMGQKVFDLINTEDLMRYYVENRETESDAWSQIEEQLDHFRNTIHELSEMLDHLSQEEQFGIPEIIDLKEHLMNIQHSEKVSGFKVSFSVDKESLLKRDESRLCQLGKNSNIEGVEKKDKETKKSDIDIEFEMFRHDVDKFNREQEQGIMNSTMNKALQVPANVMIAKNDLHRIISNIIANAKTHGFTDTSRKDYKINIILGFDEQMKMFRIDFRNNGNPLPKGMNKLRFGIKGEKAGQTAGTGLGGSVVKSIVEHYKGDYDIFMDGDWTVIRVYLPIAL